MTGPIPTNNQATLIGAVSSIEDTVRVVGISGAWPVNTFAHGLTSINNYDTKLPMLVNSTGALAVYLAAGSISVTADVSGISSLGVTLNGISVSYPTGLSNTIPIRGYTGADNVPVAVTGSVNIIGLGLTYLNNISNNTLRVLGGSGDYIGITGDVRDQINKMEFVNINDGQCLRTFDANSSLNITLIGGIQSAAATLATALTQISAPSTLITPDSGAPGNLLKVDVKRISQPDGVTSGNLGVGISTVTISNSAIGNLKSGVHFKAKLTNTGTVYVGTNSVAMTSSAENGFPLYAGDQLFVETDSITKLFYKADTAGNTLYYFAT